MALCCLADVRALILRWKAIDRGGIGSDLGFRTAPSGSWLENRVQGDEGESREAIVVASSNKDGEKVTSSG